MKPLRTTWMVALLVCLALIACERDRPAPKPGQAAAANIQGSSAQDNGPASNVDLSDIPVPTEEDFEEAAERDITIDNLESELDRMEKEIGQ